MTDARETPSTHKVTEFHDGRVFEHRGMVHRLEVTEHPENPEHHRWLVVINGGNAFGGTALLSQDAAEDLARMILSAKASPEDGCASCGKARREHRSGYSAHRCTFTEGDVDGERDATPDEAHDIGYTKGHIDGFREAREARND